jgi:hypothetical protein
MKPAAAIARILLSLRAVEIVTRIELEYGVDLVDTYFAAPIIARLAEEVRCTQDRSGD